MNLFKAKIVKRSEVADNIAMFQLANIDNSPLPIFKAGAHIDVKAPNGVVRQYSLCHKYQSGTYNIAIQNAPQSRGGSSSIFTKWKEGDIVEISEPKNHFGLIDAKKYIFLAAGIGVTPIQSMIEEINSKNIEFELHYSARTKSAAAFLEGLAIYKNQANFYFDDLNQIIDVKSILSNPKDDVHIFTCGPSGYMDFIINSAKELGWKKDNIHFEYFSAPILDETENGEFEVVLQKSGQSFIIPPDQSIAQILVKNCIKIEISCEQGVCGACKTKVIEGDIEHKDLFLFDDEKEKNDCTMICVSRAKSKKIILDL